MNLKEELKAIDNFFASLDEEEFFQMLEDCGMHRILPTEKIFAGECENNYTSYYNKEKQFKEYSNYNEDRMRNEAA